MTIPKQYSLTNEDRTQKQARGRRADMKAVALVGHKQLLQLCADRLVVWVFQQTPRIKLAACVQGRSSGQHSFALVLHRVRRADPDEFLLREAETQLRLEVRLNPWAWPVGIWNEALPPL